MTKFERLNKDNADYKANGRLVGVFLKGPVEIQIKQGNQPSPNHVGLFFADPEGVTRVFHFTDDHDGDANIGIYKDPIRPGAKLFHAPIGFDEINAVGFASYLSFFLDDANVPKLKYGLGWLAALGSFDTQGKYQFEGDEDDHGLTCATFVSELFAGHGHTLVDYAKWIRNRVPDADLDWRAAKIAALESRGRYTPERRAIMASIDPFIRLRPEEVAAVAEQDFELWDEFEHHREEGAGAWESDEDRQPTIEELAEAVVLAFAGVDWA